MDRIVTILVLMMLTLTASAQRCEHKVQRGEDFESIAQKYGITVEELMEANPDSKACYAGRKLLIPWHGVPVQQKDPEVKPFDYGLTSSAGKVVLTKESVATYQVGQALLKAQKFKEAYPYLKAAEDMGDVRSYYMLGLYHSNSNSPNFDEPLATQYFIKSAAASNDKASEEYNHACAYVAESYTKGRGVPTDYKNAKYFASECAHATSAEDKARIQKVRAEVRQHEAAIRQQEEQERRIEQEEQRRLQEQRRQQQASSHATNVAHNGGAQQGNAVRGGGFWGKGQTIYIQSAGPTYAQLPEAMQTFYFCDSFCKAIKFSVWHSVVDLIPGNPMSAELGALISGWGSSMEMALGNGLSIRNQRNYQIEGDHFIIRDNYQSVAIAKDFSWVEGSIFGRKMRFPYRITEEQYNHFCKLEREFNDRAGTTELITGRPSTSSTTYSSSNGSSVPNGNYQEMYDMYARQAESAYRSLTCTGISVTSRNGEKTGSSLGTWQGSKFSGMKTELRRAQNEMRRIRQEAQRKGINIRTSTYETATVSY